METEEDGMIVVIIEDEDEDATPGNVPVPIQVKTEPSEDTDEVDTLIEMAEKHGEHLNLDIQVKDIKTEALEFEDIEFIEENSEDEEYNPEYEDLNYEDGYEVGLNYEDSDYNEESEVEDLSRRQRWKMLRPSECVSYVKELKKQHPELRNDNAALLNHLAQVMKDLKPPMPSRDFYRVHSEDLRFECIKCGVVSNTVPATERHYQDKHGPRYLICYACGVDFRSKTNLYKHEKRCNAPDIGYVLRARALAVGRKGRHRPFLVHTDKPKEKSTQKYNCEECPAVFITKSGLLSHQNLHRGERPFKCGDCGSAYTSSSALAGTGRTTMGELANCEPPDQSKEFSRLITLLDEFYPTDWRSWEVNDIVLTYDGVFRKKISLRAYNILKVAVPTVQLARAFEYPMTESGYRRLKRTLFSWPLGRALIFNPVRLMTKIHPHNAFSGFIKVVASLKCRFITAAEAKVILQSESKDEPPPSPKKLSRPEQPIRGRKENRPNVLKRLDDYMTPPSHTNRARNPDKQCCCDKERRPKISEIKVEDEQPSTSENPKSSSIQNPNKKIQEPLCGREESTPKVLQRLLEDINHLTSINRPRSPDSTIAGESERKPEKLLNHLEDGPPLSSENRKRNLDQHCRGEKEHSPKVLESQLKQEPSSPPENRASSPKEPPCGRKESTRELLNRLLEDLQPTSPVNLQPSPDNAVSVKMEILEVLENVSEDEAPASPRNWALSPDISSGGEMESRPDEALESDIVDLPNPSPINRPQSPDNPSGGENPGLQNVSEDKSITSSKKRPRSPVKTYTLRKKYKPEVPQNVAEETATPSSNCRSRSPDKPSHGEKDLRQEVVQIVSENAPSSKKRLKGPNKLSLTKKTTRPEVLDSDSEDETPLSSITKLRSREKTPPCEKQRKTNEVFPVTRKMGSEPEKTMLAEHLKTQQEIYKKLEPTILPRENTDGASENNLIAEYMKTQNVILEQLYNICLTNRPTNNALPDNKTKHVVEKPMRKSSNESRNNVAPSEAKIVSAKAPFPTTKHKESTSLVCMVTQGALFQRLGGNFWENIEYGDVKDKFEASPVFTNLLVNSCLVTPSNSQEAILSVLETMDACLGAITYGLLQEMQHFKYFCGTTTSEVKKILQPPKKKGRPVSSQSFGRISYALIRYTCGMRMEIIKERRSVYKTEDKKLDELLHAIPPSTTHLFDEKQLKDMRTNQGVLDISLNLNETFGSEIPTRDTARASENNSLADSMNAQNEITKKLNPMTLPSRERPLSPGTPARENTARVSANKLLAEYMKAQNEIIKKLCQVCASIPSTSDATPENRTEDIDETLSCESKQEDEDWPSSSSDSESGKGSHRRFRSLATKGARFQRLGQRSWQGIDYADVQDKFEAGEAFTNLKVNSSLGPPKDSVQIRLVLEKIDRCLGAITHGLLQQRKFFKDIHESAPSTAKKIISAGFLTNKSNFLRTSDILLRYTCGKRAEIIKRRRSAYQTKDGKLDELLYAIPPSTTHLFDESRLQNFIKKEGGDVFPVKSTPSVEIGEENEKSKMKNEKFTRSQAVLQTHETLDDSRLDMPPSTTDPSDEPTLPFEIDGGEQEERPTTPENFNRKYTISPSDTAMNLPQIVKTFTVATDYSRNDNINNNKTRVVVHESVKLTQAPHPSENLTRMSISPSDSAGPPRRYSKRSGIGKTCTSENVNNISIISTSDTVTHPNRLRIGNNSENVTRTLTILPFRPVIRVNKSQFYTSGKVLKKPIIITLGKVPGNGEFQVVKTLKKQ